MPRELPVEEREALTAALYELLHNHGLLTPLDGKWAEVGAAVQSAFRACINTALAAREVEKLPGDGQLTAGEFYARAAWPVGTRVKDAADSSRRGQIVKRGGQQWASRDKLPMVRWDGKIDAEVVEWKRLARSEVGVLQRYVDVLAEALDQFLRELKSSDASSDTFRRLRNAVEPTLQALGYPKEAGA
jgi:outer membrane PBP1 activator LpoA protein